MDSVKPQVRPFRTVNWIAGFFFLAALEGIGCLVFLLSIPPDPKNAVFLGYSLSRLVMAGVLLAAAAAFFTLAWAGRRADGRLARRLRAALAGASLRRGLLGLSLIAVLAAWLNLQLEPYWYGFYHAAFERLQPFFLWAGLLGLQTFLAVWLGYGQAHPGAVRALVRGERSWLRASLIAVAAVGLAALFIILTGSGVAPTSCTGTSPACRSPACSGWACGWDW